MYAGSWPISPTRASPSTPKCQATPFVPKDVLGIQISSYQDNGFPKVSGATAGTFDIWIDDILVDTAPIGCDR